MKYIYSFIFLFALFSCSSSKTTTTAKPEKFRITQGCPQKANCEVEIHDNKTISKKTEETTGKFYPEFIEDSTKTVIKIVLDLNADQAAVDGQYREEIIFEWPKNQKQINLANEDLQDIQLLFGRFCFCDKKTVGYFEIDQGEINLEEGKFSLDFKNTQDIPQVLESISGRYKLE